MAYSGGLLACCEDCGICCYVMFCEPCAHAENIALVNEESCSICHIVNQFSEYYIRRTIARKQGLPADDCNDCCASYCCLPCLVCQNQRALKTGQ